MGPETKKKEFVSILYHVLYAKHFLKEHPIVLDVCYDFFILKCFYFDVTRPKVCKVGGRSFKIIYESFFFHFLEEIV